MTLENVLTEITEDYVNWCSEEGIKPKKEDVKNLLEVIRHGTATALVDHETSDLTLKGKFSDRETKIKFDLTDEFCIIEAWNQRYTVAIEDIKKRDITKPNYASEKKDPALWDYCYIITNEADLLAEQIYNQVEKEI